MHRAANRLFFAFVPAAVLVIAPATADVKPVQPRFVTVEVEGTPLKCQVGAPFYPVATLKAGQVLKIDGEDGEWLRAEYAPGMTAFVKADEATPAGDKIVQLQRACRLWAINASGADRSPWWNLLEHELPAGQALRVTETINNSVSGQVAGYVVEAPAQARGFIKAGAVRTASAQEISAFRRTNPQPAPEAATASIPPTIDTSSGGQTATTAVTAAPCDVDVLKARFDKVMAAKDNEQDLTALIVEFKCKLATLTAAVEDKKSRGTLEQGLNALTLRRDVLAAQKRVRTAELAAAGQLNK